jgi:2-oxo-4-hydroxy-4-carboxy-5-ureidoimidazoline decarboxylase
MERWERINSASGEEARAQLRICCGAERWIDRMLTRRPFPSRSAAVEAANEEWFALGPADWRDAFNHHPKIGEQAAFVSSAPAAAELSAREQAGVTRAPDDTKAALREANREYEIRFGYIFIVCASGKPAEEMLRILRARLKNHPDTEILVAAEEHAKICALRIVAPGC